MPPASASSAGPSTSTSGDASRGRRAVATALSPNLARYRELFDSTSVVVPCHNEKANIGPLVDALEAADGPYIHEIILVDDNSQDRTAEVAGQGLVTRVA
jgi:hypothetical protein